MNHRRTVQLALLCLKELNSQSNQWLSLHEISHRLGIPLGDCVSLLERLQLAGIVAVREPQEALLLCPLEDLSELEIVEAVWSVPKKTVAFKLLFSSQPGLGITKSLEAKAWAHKTHTFLEA